LKNGPWDNGLAVTATAESETTMRVDVYSTVHKALRAKLYDLGLELGRCDLASPAEARIALEAYRRTMGFLREHHHNEEAFVDPLIAGAAPELVAENARQHEVILAELAGLDALAERREGKALATAYNRFLARYLAHMDHEETELQEVIWDTLSDEEIGALHGRIQGSLPPGRFLEWVEIMVPAASLDERARLLGGVKRHAPPQAYEAVAAVAERVLGGAAWQAVRARAELP
jgi:hypothetical protein